LVTEKRNNFFRSVSGIMTVAFDFIRVQVGVWNINLSSSNR